MEMMGHLDEKTIKRRVYLMQNYVFNVLAARERAKSNVSAETLLWEGEEMMNELLLTAENLLLGPVPGN
jgi:beta-lactamase class A